jgi:hypothetical protein
MLNPVDRGGDTLAIWRRQGKASRIKALTMTGRETQGVRTAATMGTPTTAGSNAKATAT